MTSRDFRLLTARITLTAPIVAKRAETPKPAAPRLSLSRRPAAKPVR